MYFLKILASERFYCNFNTSHPGCASIFNQIIGNKIYEYSVLAVNNRTAHLGRAARPSSLTQMQTWWQVTLFAVSIVDYQCKIVFISNSE